jgi:hypothetical protein
MPTYVSPFTGTVVTPTDVSYLYLTPEFSYNFYWPSSAPPDQYVLPRILDIEPLVADLYFIILSTYIHHMYICTLLVDCVAILLSFLLFFYLICVHSTWINVSQI